MPAMATKVRLVKLCLYANRKPHLTEDEFHEYWTGKHQALAKDWLMKHGIVRYTQVSEGLGTFCPHKTRSFHYRFFGCFMASSPLPTEA
jgi:hypothetical protein